MKKRNQVTVGKTKFEPILFHDWETKILERMEKLFTEMFGEKNPDTNLFDILLDATATTIPKEIYNEPTITKDKLYGEIAVKMNEPDIDFIFLDMMYTVEREVINKHPSHILARRTLESFGLNMYDFILDLIYRNVDIDIDITGVAKRSGIEVVD